MEGMTSDALLKADYFVFLFRCESLDRFIFDHLRD